MLFVIVDTSNNTEKDPGTVNYYYLTHCMLFKITVFFIAFFLQVYNRLFKLKNIFSGSCTLILEEFYSPEPCFSLL